MTNRELLQATLIALSTPVKRGFLPVRIKVVVPPDKLIYQDNELVDLTGIKVVAFCDDGSIWGEIPVDELYCVPDHAGFTWHGAYFVTPNTSIIIGNRTIHGPFYAKRISRKQRVTQPIPAGYTVVLTDPVPDAFGFNDNGAAVVIDSENVGSFQLVAATDGDFIVVASKENYGTSYGGYSTIPDVNDYYPRVMAGLVTGIGRFTNDGKTVYWHGFSTRYIHPDMTVSEHSFDTLYSEIAWYLCYGANIPYTSTQDITVKWPRPGDGAVLSDTFSITVYMENN